jgi:hypothetical protein
VLTDGALAPRGRARGGSTNVASTNIKRGRIRVSLTGSAYRIAREQGDVRELAAALAHEQFHLDHPDADEIAALDAGLRVLRRLHVAEDVIAATERLKDDVPVDT